MATPPEYPHPDVIARLADPAAYPEDPAASDGVETIQTHLSHVFLTRDRVYKFRKAVDLGFVRFASRDARNADCLREVALNRRLAPDVYLGVAPLRSDGGGVRLGRPAETLAGSGGGEVEHCVVMRRLPEGRDALSLLKRGELSPEQLARVAERIAGFHALHRLGRPAPFSAREWLACCTEPAEASLRAIAASGVVADACLGPAAARCRGFAAAHAARFEARRLAGRAVDAHGDLHLQHVWFETDAAQPLMIDCLEFDAGLRHIDAAAEVAFTAMDLGYRGRGDLAERFLRHYAEASDDFELYAVVDYFVAYRALVRAKVAAIAAGDRTLPAAQRSAATRSARRHVRFAAGALAPRVPGGVVLVGGVVGTGKTTVAEALAEALDAGPGVAVVSSDRVRKALAGLSPLARTDAGPDEGLYAPEAVSCAYRALVERAGPVSRSGRVAVLDATWASRAERARAFELAHAAGAPALFVETRCAGATALERLRRRREAADDPSDAGPERHAASVARFEPFAAAEAAGHRIVATDRAGWRDQVAGIAAGLRDQRSSGIATA